MNVGLVDSLSHGKSAVELYSDQCRKTSISHDKLLLASAQKAVEALKDLLVLGKGKSRKFKLEKSGKDGMLTKEVKVSITLSSFPWERFGLWHEVKASVYGTHPNGWDANMVVRWSHRCPWKAIPQVFLLFSQHTRLVVGNGEKIRFWEDL